MYRLIGIIALCVVTALSWPSAAAVAASPKIAVVDLQRVLEESIVGKASKANLDKSMKEAKARLEIERIKMEQMQQELQKQKSLLSAEAWSNRRMAFMKAERDFQRQVADSQEELQARTAQNVQKIMDQVTRIAAEIAADKGFDFVIEKDVRFVLYADSGIDVSKEVISALDKKKLQL